ncbi:MAG: NAD-dependent epimerase/dehydratase family protein [Brevundimonas sp.]
MRIFLAGSTGVIGRHLVPLFVAAGHDVAGMTRSPAAAAGLRDAGAVPVVCDVFDAAALTAAVATFAPDVVMHQLTDLPDDAAALAGGAAANARIRIEGTRNLVAAAQAAGASRFLAQSIAWTPTSDVAARAKLDLERQVLEIGGVVLRYGQFYGPGTYFPDELPPEPRVEVGRAASLTVTHLTDPSGIVTVVD